MVTGPEPRRDDPFGGFTVTTEAMADGRSIHYYDWPAEDSGGRDADASGPPEQGEPAEDGAETP